MTGLDFFLLVFLASYVWVGFASGLIQSVGSFLGLFLGVFAASRWFAWLGPVIAPLVGGALAGSIVAFILLFVVVSRFTGIVVVLINKIFNLIAIVPGLRLTNRLGGAAFGFVEGALAIGITLHFVSRLPIGATATHALTTSRLVPYFAKVTDWLVGLLPEVLRNVQSVLMQ